MGMKRQSFPTASCPLLALRTTQSQPFMPPLKLEQVWHILFSKTKAAHQVCLLATSGYKEGPSSTVSTKVWFGVINHSLLKARTCDESRLTWGGHWTPLRTFRS